MRLEFRIPISPTSGFFAQIRMFDFALRRLGPPYSLARLLVCVGDDCDIAAVRAANAWSAGSRGVGGRAQRRFRRIRVCTALPIGA